MNDIKILENLFASYILIFNVYKSCDSSNKVYLKNVLASLHVTFDLIFEKITK